MTKISAVVLTKNEEKIIEQCLNALSFCDEIVVVDDGSTDATVAIAKKHNARVFTRPMAMDFSAQSNFGMAKARGDWVLFIDADERIGRKLASEIKWVIDSTDSSGFFIKRIDYFFGQKMTWGEIKNTRLMRLVKKGSGKWKRRVHPYFEISGEVGQLTNPLFHYPHPSMRDFVTSVDRWSTWHALAKFEEGKTSSLGKIIVWPIAKFIANFIVKLGFLDGTRGAVYCFMLSFHSYLSWSKLWLAQRRSKKDNSTG